MNQPPGFIEPPPNPGSLGTGILFYRAGIGGAGIRRTGVRRPASRNEGLLKFRRVGRQRRQLTGVPRQGLRFHGRQYAELDHLVEIDLIHPALLCHLDPVGIGLGEGIHEL